ncbi:hypothetical protein D9756_000917 [Leucocoprinus leucothites]|uniref:Uncharacterized protein n=1 Tax=Leucocoprinus leucothites TaxID=201217 RepID=A0A8H5LNL0_9AGAR|nr:hypothetical protein D9756_000917 [Leucoagaricus leucothites]
MFPSLRSCVARSHQPLIRFIGRRQWPSTTEAPHPHPAASAEFREHFADFLKKQLGRSSSSASRQEDAGDATAFNYFWEAPSKFWNPRVRELEESEMEAIMTGGASSYSRK